MLLRYLSVFVLALVSSNLSAFEPAKPFPKTITEARFKISDKTIGKMTEIPAGSHADNEMRMVFTGHQKGINASILFGPIGAVVASNANSSGGKKTKRELGFDGELNVVELCEQAILVKMEGVEGFRFSEDAKPVFSVMPYVFVARNKKTDENKAFAMVKVELFAEESDAKPVWMTRFYGEVKGVFKTDELKDNEAIAQLISEAFERTAWGISRVVEMRFDEYEPISIKAWMPCLKNDKLKLNVVSLAEENGDRLLRLPYGKAFLLSGYTVLGADQGVTEPLKKFKDKYRSDFETEVKAD